MSAKVHTTHVTTTYHHNLHFFQLRHTGTTTLLEHPCM